MLNLLIIAENKDAVTGLSSSLVRNGCSCPVVSGEKELATQLTRQTPDAILMATSDYQKIEDLSRRVKQSQDLPVIALVARDTLDAMNSQQSIDDFIVEPYNVTELLVRIRRLLKITAHHEDGELIKCDDLVIDLDRYEVSVSGRPVMLTFREYELLKFMARHRGRVFTREALLTGVWGYDYFGGDRTVDVHIRRLRSKIEDPHHTFIETVRNIGYRFTKKG
ncbi:MAG: response regulator transcription factor [Dehalococcoidales bacterium]|nr:response regulator transcription factor [Dehalococcoidales bacterium]